MRAINFLGFLTFLCVAQLSVYSQHLSPNARISILTCGPGEELYSVFGHSAIRVYDPDSKIDMAYNYGTFNFGDPDFYIKFIRGKLKYYLATAPYEDFVEFYNEEERYVYEQELNLPHEDVENVYAFLKQNDTEKNRYYLYDFFYDNCTTRELSLLEKVLNKKLLLPANSGSVSPSSFRNLIDPYLVNMPWSDFGIDLGLGAVTDRKIRFKEYTFLPEELRKFLTACRISYNGISKPLVLKERLVVRGATLSGKNPELLNPVFCFWIVLILFAAASLLYYRKGRYVLWMDYILFGSIGLLGMLLFFLWFGTDHKATAWNYNLLWALPTHFVFIFFLAGWRRYPWLSFYCKITAILCLFLLALWPVLPQQLHPAFIPLLLLLLMRAWIIAAGISKNVVRNK